ncbi:MAG: hypothetical protein QW453_00185 [Thermoprotei archaeon]
MRERSGQFIIITATIILVIIIVLVASIHQTSTTPQSPPPIYASVESVNQSLLTVLVDSLANYSHTVITQVGGCSSPQVYTPSPDQPAQMLFNQLISNLTYVYSSYGLLIGQTQPTYTVAWCTGPQGSGSTTISATFRFNLTNLGIYNYRDELRYSLEAYTPSCTINDDTLTCAINVIQAGSFLSTLNQSYFFLSQDSGWLKAQSAVDYDNGTYTVSWQLEGTPVPPFVATIAVENQQGVYVVTSGEV